MRLPRPTPARILLTIVVVAFGLAAALIGVSMAGSGGSGSQSEAAVYGAAETSSLLSGIPQHGNVLGHPEARVTLVEYADLQCPFCGVWARETMPTLVREYVRPGKVKLVFRGLAFVGKDSEPALRTALAAGAQNRLWHVVDLLFRNQGEENTGWVTNSLLRSIGEAVPGLDVPRMLDERDASSTQSALNAAAAGAAEAGVHSTPSFEVGLTDGPMRQMTIGSLEPSAFRPKLDELLSS